MQKKYILLFFSLLAIVPYAPAQEPWTLEQCIRHAFENNIQIKQQELNVKLSEGNMQQTKLSTLPSLNASSNHAYSFGRVTNYVTNQKESRNTQSTSFSINSSLNLFNGFQTTNSRKQDRFDLMATVSDVENIKNDIALSVASVYLQILYNQELLAVATRQVELSQMQVERTGVLVKAGSLPEGNLLEIEALMATDELQLVNAQNQLDLAVLNITQLLEIKSPAGFSIQSPELSKFESGVALLEPSDVFSAALQAMPQILSASNRASSSAIGLRIAKGGLSPRLSLNGNYNTGVQRYINANVPGLTNDPFFTQIKDNANTSISLNLSIPIFNGWQVRNGIANAKIALDRSRLTLENEKNILYKDIQQAYTDALAAQKKLKASQKNRTALDEAFRYAEQKFSVGLVTVYDYTNAKTKLAKAEADLLQAKYELVFKTKILEFYQGVPLSL